MKKILLEIPDDATFMNIELYNFENDERKLIAKEVAIGVSNVDHIYINNCDSEIIKRLNNG